MTESMKLFRFLDWKVYKDSKLLYSEILKLEKNFSYDIKLSLGAQILRSSLSVSLNIAEGSAKHSDKDFNRFLNTALGSLNETVANLDILRDNSLITEQEFDQLTELAISITRQLGGLKKKLV